MNMPTVYKYVAKLIWYRCVEVLKWMSLRDRLWMDEFLTWRKRLSQFIRFFSVGHTKCVQVLVEIMNKHGNETEMLVSYSWATNLEFDDSFRLLNSNWASILSAGLLQKISDIRNLFWLRHPVVNFILTRVHIHLLTIGLSWAMKFTDWPPTNCAPFHDTSTPPFFLYKF